jgi:hypothetical protein
VDWNVWWKDRTYRLMGNFAAEHVAGDSLAILRLQRSSARYFQRPDREAGATGSSPAATTRGSPRCAASAGTCGMAKDAGTLAVGDGGELPQPGFEVNDIAFLSRADYVWMLANVNGYWTKPTKWYRSLVRWARSSSSTSTATSRRAGARLPGRQLPTTGR